MEVCCGEGGVSAEGTVREGVVVLTSVAGKEVGPMELSQGHLLVFEGLSLAEVVQQLPDACQVTVCVRACVCVHVVCLCVCG